MSGIYYGRVPALGDDGLGAKHQGSDINEFFLLVRNGCHVFFSRLH
jgi:hypothetical protein